MAHTGALWLCEACFTGRGCPGGYLLLKHSLHNHWRRACNTATVLPPACSAATQDLKGHPFGCG